MCGICGTFSARVGADPEGTAYTLRGLMDRAQRRGPDDAGYWTDERRCAMGFRRLSILDLSYAGHQPMLTEDGRYALVFNGEVYNFEELRARLQARGVPFRSTGDSEVVLKALAEWGTAALSDFSGMFALAFYDAVAQRLLLARDHAGIKPLYYLHRPEGFAFASQYDQLIHHPLAQELEVSQEALSLYLRFGYIPAPYAMLRQTHLLDAGSWMTVDARGRVEQGRFYSFPVGRVAELRGAEAVDALDEALKRAVSRHLISDVPVGVFLSGGIDSPLVAAEAQRQSRMPLSAFSIGVSDPQLDEAVDARRYAEELGLRQFVRMAEAEAALDLLDDVAEACSEPSADYSIFPTLMVSRLAQEHVKVVLSGDGGDELFWGYPARFGAAIEQAPYYRLPRLMRYGAIAARKYLNQGAATRDVLWDSVGRFFQKKHTVMHEGDLERLFPDLMAVPADLDLFDYDGADSDEVAYWIRWNEFRLHLARILLKVDRASMFCSLEVRVPLLDKEVIEVAAKTDWQSCLSLPSRRGKVPLRQALRRRVAYQTQAKKGFTVPMQAWLTGVLHPILQEEVLSRRDFLGFRMNPVVLEEMHTRLQHGDRQAADGLWLLLSLARWEARHLKSRTFQS